MNKNLANYIWFIVLGFCLMSLSKCMWRSNHSEINKSDKEQFYKKLYLINVNDQNLFNDARIKGSINLAFNEIENKVKNLNKDFKTIVYCTDYACTESDRVAKVLKNLGFKNILIYRGGIQEWYQLSLKDPKDYPFEGPATTKFLKRPIEKMDSDLNSNEIQIINAQDLSKLLKISANK